MNLVAATVKWRHLSQSVKQGGAEDARTPDADAWSADSTAREAFGVRPTERSGYGAFGSLPETTPFGHASSAESKAAWRFASRRTPKRWLVG